MAPPRAASPMQGATPAKLSSAPPALTAPASFLSPCRWLDNDTLVDSSIKLTNFPEKDADRIVVRIPLPHKKGETGLTIKVSTEGADAGYNDDPTEIEIHETSPQSGIFESLPFVIVSDIDDDNALDGTLGDGDNQKNDRTHIGQGGGKLMVEADALGTAKIKVPIKKATHFFEVTTVILDVPGDDLEVAPAKIKMNSQINWMAQTYRPYGVEVRQTDGGVITVDSTNKANIHTILENYEVNISSTGPGSDVATIIADADVTAKKTAKNIVLIYVNARLYYGLPGYAVGIAPTGIHDGYVLVSLYELVRDINEPDDYSYVSAHECGHVLELLHRYLPASGGDSVEPPQNNLMRDGFDRWGRIPDEAGMSGRRLLREQIDSILASPLMQTQPSN